MSIVGEAVLTASVEFLINKLASSELLSFEKQITNRFVKSWLVDLQNLAYDVEDILDEFETVAMERKLSHPPTEASTRTLRVLLLEWSNSDIRNEETEKQVLDMLRPNQKLEQLTIRGYGGRSLPGWLGETLFSNLVLLRIENCRNCTSLPSVVGQLSSLKELDIQGMYGIKTVDPEFYGNGCFPSLETLNFEDIGEWEEWISHGTGQKLKRFLTCNNFQSLVVPNCKEGCQNIFLP
ncbi:hypothetical protein ACOSQ2_004069 [Xanthoceras sorbifolium]